MGAASLHTCAPAAGTKADVAADMSAHVLPGLVAGRLQVPVCETFTLPEAQRAYDRFGAGGKFGKVVLLSPDA